MALTDPSFEMVSGYGKVIGISKVRVKIFKLSYDVIVFILDSKNLKKNILVGLDLIERFRLVQTHKLKVYQKKFRWQRYKHTSRKFIVNFVEMSADLSHLDKNKSNVLGNVISNFNHAFAKDKFDTGMVKDHEARIKLTENKYVYRKPYKCNIIDQQEIENQVSKLLQAGLIEESSSPFAAPVTLASKKYADGSVKKDRMCIDYSALNKFVVPESQPFPLIEDLIVKARDCTWFSVLDINSAFWSIPMREKDAYKTAFVTQTGHYNWKCLPFGLKTSPAIFQRILRNVLKRNDLDGFAVNYIDDILVFSKSFDEHIKHLKKLLKAISDEGFRLSLSKCNFAKNKVKYLGHVIENNVTRPISDNVAPLRSFPIPATQKQVRQFLGKVNFYHSYIPNSAITLAPLHNLLRKNVPFVWSDDCQDSFKKVIDCLCSEPCLAIFSPEKETFVQTDASQCGIGAILKQRQEDGTIKPVAYFSKKLTEAQKRKKAVFLECLAIREALAYWSHRLRGIKFKIFSDHKPLENKQINTKFDDELRELILELSQFDFDFIYVPGPTNAEADCLSRNPVFEAGEPSNDLKVVNLVEMKTILEDQHKNLEDFSKKFNFILEDKVMFSKYKDSKRIIISDELALDIIKKVHSKLGHIGPKQMQLAIFPFFYNTNFRRMIKKYCHNCPICIKNKTRSPILFGSLSQLGPATEPFEYMSLDTVGGFSGNNSTKKYFHLLVDHFTRFAYCLTSKTQQTSDFIKIVSNVLKDGHKIKNLLADQYAAINCNKFKEFLISKDINFYLTAVDNPASNGLNERLNQTLVNRLRCKANESVINKGKPWSVLLEQCVNEYNNTIHTVTGFTPNYLMNNVKFSLFPELNIDLKNCLEKDRETAFRNSQKAHLANKKIFDKNKNPETFSVGDLVYVLHGNSLNRNKLDEIRIGPFKIKRVISKSMYEVDSGFQKKESNIYHVSKLYPYNVDVVEELKIVTD